MAVSHGSGWIDATIRGNRADFTYTANDSYGYEQGSGYLVFSGGKVNVNPVICSISAT